MLIIVGVIIIAGAYLCTNMSVAVPQQLKLGDLSGDVTTTSVVWPNARQFQIVIGLAPTIDSCPPFQGSIRVKDGDTMVEQYEISEKDAVVCNWLMHEHQLGRAQ